MQDRARALLQWYARARRDLPWRRTSDPWAIWVSEVMLQQTRVEAVREPYLRFLQRFPDPKSLAAADDDTLLTAWKGLGYYQRARRLRDGARRTVAEHEGRVPDDPERFGALPGVGPYTKGAVLSIAFDRPLPALDGNVERVLARLLALDGDPKRKPVRTRMNEIVRTLHEHGRPGEINQALMELGATVCTPRKPSCLVCPWHDGCRARRQGRTEELPRLPRRQQSIDVTTEVCLVQREDRVLARRVHAGAINEGQLCLPGLGLPVPQGNDLQAHLEAKHGLRGTPGAHLTTLRHGITRYRVRIEVYSFSPAPPFARPGRGLVYESPHDATKPWTTVARKVFAKLRRQRR